MNFIEELPTLEFPAVNLDQFRSLQPLLHEQVKPAIKKLENGDVTAAETYLTNITRVNPSNVLASYLLGSIKVSLGNRGESVEHFERAAKIAPTPYVLETLGAALEAAGFRSHSENVYKEILEEGDNLTVALRLGDQYFKETQTKKAREMYLSALAAYPGYEQIIQRMTLVDQAIDQGWRGGAGEGYPKISAVINTRNEEYHIENCLRCLRLVDEIVVVDMESRDKTAQIAAQFADKVVSISPQSVVEAARSEGVEYAQHTWLIITDPDEYLPRALIQALYGYLANHGNQVDGLTPPVNHYFLGRRMRWDGIYSQPKIIKRDRFNFTTRVHQGLAGREGCAVQTIPYAPEIAMDHYAVSSLAGRWDKIDRYTQAQLRDDDAEGLKFDWAETAQVFGKTLGDIDHLIDSQPADPRDLLRALYGGIEAIKRQAQLYELHLTSGTLDQSQQRAPKTAREFLEEVLKHVR